MDFAPVYLLNRALFRTTDFFHHWYVDGSRFIFHFFISLLARLDGFLALGVTARYFFHPLYGDYSVFGRILGVVFRTLRISLAIFVYGVLSVVFVLAYSLWLAAPFAVIFFSIGAFSSRL